MPITVLTPTIILTNTVSRFLARSQSCFFLLAVLHVLFKVSKTLFIAFTFEFQNGIDFLLKYRSWSRSCFLLSYDCFLLATNMKLSTCYGCLTCYLLQTMRQPSCLLTCDNLLFLSFFEHQVINLAACFLSFDHQVINLAACFLVITTCDQLCSVLLWIFGHLIHGSVFSY